MSIDIVDLRSFYAGALGQVTRDLLLASIRRRWENLGGMALMGLGYATPYLGPSAARRSAPSPSCRRRRAW